MGKFIKPLDCSKRLHQQSCLALKRYNFWTFHNLNNVLRCNLELSYNIFFRIFGTDFNIVRKHKVYQEEIAYRIYKKITSYSIYSSLRLTT